MTDLKSHAPAILIVDDNESKRYTVKRQLRDQGYALHEAATGEQAIAMARALKPELMVLDIKLPDIDGYEVCRRIRADPEIASTAILHFSATLNTMAARIHGLEEGADAFLTQDAESEELIATVKALLRMRRAEQSLREREQLISSVLESSPDCIKVIDLEGKLLSINKTGLELLEFGDGETCVNQSWVSLWPEAGQPQIREAFEQAKAGKTTWLEAFCPTARQTPKWWDVMLTPILDKGGKPLQILSVSRDITKRREKDEVVRRQNERLQILSEAAAKLLANDNPENVVDELFRKVARHMDIDAYFNFMLDEKREKLVLNAFAGITDEQAENVHYLQLAGSVSGQVIETKKPVILAHIQAKDDSTAAALRNLGMRAYVCNPLMAGNLIVGTLGFASRKRDAFSEDEIKFLFMICHYVALAKEKAALLEEAQTRAEQLKEANRRKDEFLANMSHEIRTPMNAIIGIGHILMTTSPLSDKQLLCVRTLQTSSESLLALINDLLDIAKIESENIELENIPFSLSHVMDGVLDMLRVRANEKRIALQMEYDTPVAGEFIGDPNRLKQIMINLVSNAVKFTEKGGVKVSARVSEEAAGLCQVELSVADSGIGISRDKLDSIFSKFSQADTSIARKYGGTGLGLAISKHLSELMGGAISVASEEGEGAVFTVKLPFARATPMAVANSVLRLSTAQSGEEAPFILLVEDYAPNMLVVSTIMENAGYRYDMAKNGAEALQKIQSQTYDVVLMDVQMPGMDGYTATRHLREFERRTGSPRVGVIGITAYALTGDREKCLKEGMDDYISKPFAPAMLKQKIEALLRKEERQKLAV